MGVNAGQVTVFSNNISNNLLRIGTRINSTQISGYDNGVIESTTSSTSVGVPVLDVAIGALNNNGTIGNFWNGTISSFIAGAGVGFNNLSYFNALTELNAALTP